jgi:hypothetical protein
LTGFYVDFYVVASQAIVIASNPVDTLAVHNDLAADTITTAATPGQNLQVICDGTQWLVISNPSAATTATAVTAVTIAS